MAKGRKVKSQVDFPILFEDVVGNKWRRAKINRNLMNEIQNKEVSLQQTYEEAQKQRDAAGDTTNYYQLFEVRLASISPYIADENGLPVVFDEIDMGDGQHLYQGFWRSVWGLDPLGNLR